MEWLNEYLKLRPGEWEFWAFKFPVWFILIDLYGYAIHKFGYHRYAFLWQFHKVHHEAFTFNFHPMEMFFNWGLPFVLSWPVMGFWFCCVALGIILFESNRGHDGELRIVQVPKQVYTGWVTRGYHKQHHLDPSCNYAQVTKLGDWLFGTMKRKVTCSI